MITYEFTMVGGEKTVTVNGQPLQLKRLTHEPKGYVSPERLGLSILFDVRGDTPPSWLTREFQMDIVDECEAGDQFTADEVREWVDFTCRLAGSVQTAILTGDDQNMPTDTTPLIMPRIFRVKKLRV